MICAPDTERPPSGVALLRVKAPYLAFAHAMAFLIAPERPAPGVQPGAHVEPTATLGEGCTVMTGAYLGAHAALGPRSVLYPGAVVLERCRVGADCLLYPGVVLREECVLGDRVILLSSRPGRVVAEFRIGIERPRRIDSAPVSRAAAQITDCLREEVRRPGD